MVGRELDPESPIAIHDDAVPVVVGVDRAAEEPRPKGALGMQVASIEHVDHPGDAHDLDGVA